MEETQADRRRVLKAVIDSDGDTDVAEIQIAANGGLIPCYAVVSEYGPAYTGESYSIDLADDLDACLKQLGEGFPDHGRRDVVDTGEARDVATVFVARESSSEPAHDFSHVLSGV